MFGGLVYLSDYNTESRGKESQNGSAIAKRIETDQKNDKRYISTKKNK